LIRYPLTPIDRHPLLSPRDWRARLASNLDRVQSEKSIAEFLAVSNSLALFALISGDSCLAEDCLSAQFIVCRQREELLEDCFDGFVNVLRLFNKSEETSIHFERIATDIVKSPDEIGRRPVRFMLGGEEFRYIVPKSYEITLLQNIVYELMVGQCNKAIAFNLLEDLKSWSRSFGTPLIFMELQRRFGNDVYVHLVRSETGDYLYDNIIGPAYTCDACIDFDKKRAESALSTCIIGLLGIQAVGKISARYFRILEFIIIMARQFERPDLVGLFCTAAVEAAADDWYMTQHFKSIMNSEKLMPLTQIYSREKNDLAPVAESWRDVFSLLRAGKNH
jgi:hypothetical protein